MKSNITWGLLTDITERAGLLLTLSDGDEDYRHSVAIDDGSVSELYWVNTPEECADYIVNAYPDYFPLRDSVSRIDPAEELKFVACMALLRHKLIANYGVSYDPELSTYGDLASSKMRDIA